MTIKTIALITALSASALAFADDTKGNANKDPNAKTSSTDKPMSTDKSRTAKEKLTDSELGVLSHYRQLDQTEISMGKMAEKVGGTKAVKNYGAMLVKDHGKSERDMASFAKKNGMTIPKQTATNDADSKDMKDAQDNMTKLHALKGAEFDREFLSMMVADHEKELSKIDTNVGQVSNSDLQMMLKDMKPVLQKHADMARELQKSNAQAAK